MAKIKFNPKNKKVLTSGECLEPAMEIRSKANAREYLEDYIAFIDRDLKRVPISSHGKTAEQIAKSNLAYYAGYYSNETRKRVEDLFDCAHPTFGSIKENGIPKGDEAFRCGFENKTLKQIRNEAN